MNPLATAKDRTEGDIQFRFCRTGEAASGIGRTEIEILGVVPVRAQEKWDQEIVNAVALLCSEVASGFANDSDEIAIQKLWNAKLAFAGLRSPPRDRKKFYLLFDHFYIFHIQEYLIFCSD